MQRLRTIFFLAFVVLAPAVKAQHDVPAITLSKAERALYEQICNYRRQKGLPSVPLSKNLTYVAQLHVRDLSENHPYGKRCNLHSWSDKGPWSPCCYTEDHSEAACMWNKPKELSNYPGYGYEIAYWTNEPLNAENFARKALAGWMRSIPHNTVIINQGRWRSKEWKSMGIGVFDGYAVVWFGEEADREELIIHD